MKDLRLYPELYGKSGLSLDVLTLDRDEYLFVQIEDFCNEHGVIEMPIKLAILDHFFKRDMPEIKCKDLVNIMSDIDQITWKNKAILGYLKEMPDDILIGLYWY